MANNIVLADLVNARVLHSSDKLGVQLAARQASMFFNGALNIDVESDMMAADIPDFLTGHQIPANVYVAVITGPNDSHTFSPTTAHYNRDVLLVFRQHSDAKGDLSVQYLDPLSATTSTGAQRVLFADDGDELRTMLNTDGVRNAHAIMGTA